MTKQHQQEYDDLRSWADKYASTPFISLALQTSINKDDSPLTIMKRLFDLTKELQNENQILRDTLGTVRYRLYTRSNGIHMDGTRNWLTPLHKELYELVDEAL